VEPTEQEYLELLMMFIIVLASAKILEEIMIRLKLVPVLGDLLAGIILGPSLLSIIKPNGFLNTLATLGIILLLLLVGMETDIGKLKRYEKISVISGSGGAIVSFILGATLGLIFGYNIVSSLFIGAILIATSVGITVRTLLELHVYGTKEAYVILGAAVIDDIYGLLALALVYTIARGSGGASQAYTIFLAFIGLLVIILVFHYTSKHIKEVYRVMKHLKSEEAHFIFILIYSMVVALAVGMLGLSPIVGAFFIGLAFSKMPGVENLREKLSTLVAIFTPIYFVTAGLMLNIRILHVDLRSISIALLIILAGFLSKIIGCGFILKPFRFRMRELLTIGVGMVPRAEVATIIAVTGLAAGIITQEIFLGAILLVYTSSLLTPILLKQLLLRKR